MNIAPLPVSTDTGWEYGYLTQTGSVATTSADNGMVSPFIPVASNSAYTVDASYTLPSTYSGWVAVVQYDENYSRVGSRTISTGSKTAFPSTITLSTNATTKYIRVCASNLYGDENAFVSVGVSWIMDSEVGAIPEKALPIPDSSFTKPYPVSLWRIDGSNDGIPYNDLMPDVVYVFPEIHLPNPPEINTGQTTVIDDESSIEYVRYQVGYTNPNLYRFRDGELPKGVKCEVSIRGTNSYRYTEIPDYEDGSTTCEIP